MQKIDKQLNKLLDIISSVVLATGGEKEHGALIMWPISTPKGLLYWGDEWSQKFNRVFHLIDQKNIIDTEIARALMFSSRPAQLLWRIDAIKDSSLSKEEKLYTVSKLFNCLVVFRKKDLFCEDGRNIIWNKRELEKHKRDISFFSIKSSRLRHLISRLETTLWLYTELLYWTNHPFGHSFHGPYLDKTGMLLVREYFDLRPEIWPFSQKLKFSQLEIFETYQKIDSKLEFFERGIRTTKDFKKDLKGFALKVNGKTIGRLEQISRYMENLIKVVRDGTRINRSLNQKEMIEKHAEIWFYAIKPLCDLIEEDWHPSKQVKDNIYKKYKGREKTWEKIQGNFRQLTTLPFKQQELLTKESFDPRK